MMKNKNVSLQKILHYNVQKNNDPQTGSDKV